MFKKDATEIIKDELEAIYREGMTTEMFTEGAVVRLSGLLESPHEYRVKSAGPGYEPGSITVSLERIRYT